MLVGYARVSTLDQNPRMQIDALESAGCRKIYAEKKSGADAERKELKAAVEYMREGDVLVVWKLSRLARSLTKVISTVKDLEGRGIGLKVLTQSIDTTTPEGRLFFHVNAAFDQFQREIIVDTTKAGLAAARERGRVGGRPIRMTEEKIRAAKSMIKDKENHPFVAEIAKALDIGRTTFYRHFPPDLIARIRSENDDGIRN